MCPRCTGLLFRDEDERVCYRCGHRVYPRVWQGEPVDENPKLRRRRTTLSKIAAGILISLVALLLAACGAPPHSICQWEAKQYIKQELIAAGNAAPSRIPSRLVCVLAWNGQPSLAHRPQASAIPEGPTPPPFNKDDGTTLFLRPTFLSSPPEGSVPV